MSATRREITSTNPQMIWPDRFELHHGIAIVFVALALMHWLIYPRVSTRLSYETLQIMAMILAVGGIILWLLPSQ